MQRVVLFWDQAKPFVSYLASPSPMLLHDHLGHTHLSKLKKMILQLSKLKS